MGERLVSETFIGRLRDELLERELFVNLKEAQVLLEDYRKHYNHERPHGALGYLTPAEFAALEALSEEPGPCTLRTATICTKALIMSGTENGGRSKG